ncbi:MULTISPECIES: ATP-binding protein [Streptomyces]|uniref:ATP-binding protein n=1 Tax=Streptomyces TaxID=1883 RepID=UPI0021E08867|nr:BTAD domain-containing putative transcriptional regulator [Streptomyces venezuelae]
MRALHGAGRQSEAVAAYTELRTLLADELGLDPSPGLAALYEAILRQDAGLTPVGGADGESLRVTATVPPVLPARDPHAPRRQNLPTPPTALVGRGPAREAVVRLVGAERLVTLTGPGGVGKTRLALAVAEQAARDPGDSAPDGVWFVEFGGLPAETAELVQAVASALGIRDTVSSARGTADTSAASHGALRDRRVLLVLDNCEHVIEPAAELAASLLRTAPGVRLLATSRESLRVPGETVYAVAPLEPEDAARLFTERAVAATPDHAADFAPGGDPGQDDDDGGESGEDRDAVAEICRRPDGLPLALELAATRVRALGARELALRLGDRFRVLASGQRGLPARQQTLRAVIDWSWELLSPPEQAVLRRLAVPVGGCAPEAAESVCAGEGIDRDEVPDLVGRLVDRSLVSVARSAGGPRCHLLESVAAYARERLHEAGEFTVVADRHALHHRLLAEGAEPRLRGAGQRLWLARLDVESANLRAALDHSLSDGRVSDAARLVAALCPWWLLRGRLHEARRTLAAVVDALPAGTAAEEAAELRALLVAFTLLTGERTPDAARPETDYAEADHLEASVADPARLGRALWLFAYGLHHAGDPARPTPSTPVPSATSPGPATGGAPPRPGPCAPTPRSPPTTFGRRGRTASPPPRPSMNSATAGVIC